MDDKKKYLNPEAEIIELKNDDIVTISCDESETAGYEGEDF